MTMGSTPTGPSDTGSPADRPEASPWNVPNALTAFRCVLVPVFAWMLLSHPYETSWRIASTVLFAVAILTDSIDGHLARKYDIITKFG